MSYFRTIVRAFVNFYLVVEHLLPCKTQKADYVTAVLVGVTIHFLLDCEAVFAQFVHVMEMIRIVCQYAALEWLTILHIFFHLILFIHSKIDLQLSFQKKTYMPNHIKPKRLTRPREKFYAKKDKQYPRESYCMT